MAKMTGEEAIRELSYIADEMPSMECGDWKEVIYMAIKAIEILNNIRTEIEQMDEGISSYHNDRPWVFKDEVLQIIDKYRESEE